MKYWVKMWKNIFVFTGRATRAEYWYGVLFGTLINLGIALVSGLALGVISPMILDKKSNPGIFGVIFIIVFLVCAVFCFAQLIAGASLFVRRMHDRNKSGNWWFAMIIAFAAVVALFILWSAALFSFTKLAIIIMVLICIAGIASCALPIYVFVQLVKQGTPGPNKYGADPRGGTGMQVPYPNQYINVRQNSSFVNQAPPPIAANTPINRFCKHCGTATPATAKFCGKCGERTGN